VQATDFDLHCFTYISGYGKEFGKCNDRKGCCSEVWILNHRTSVTGRSAVAKCELEIFQLQRQKNLL